MTGGGTAGHVTPNISMIPKLKALGFEINYIGRKEGIEKDLIEQTGIPYHSISAGKMRRYLDIRNVTDIFLIIKGLIQSLYLIGKLRPHVVFSKGGFVSVPVVWAAWMKRVPAIVHESDMSPGLANRLSMPFARQICFSFPETEQWLPEGKATYTGIPVRETLFTGDREKGKKCCDFIDQKPVLLVIGGSLGSKIINRTIRSALDVLLKEFNICHICGRGNTVPELEIKPGYKQLDYADAELPDLLAMTDLVISRAGATMLFELLALRKPSLLIPLSLKASRGDQIQNADSFVKQGFSHLLKEEDLTEKTLLDSLRKTYSVRAAMVESMDGAGTVNGVEQVVRIIVRYAEGRASKDKTTKN